MKTKWLLGISLLLLFCKQPDHQDNSNELYPQQLFKYSDNLTPRWISFENISGKKGAGGLENNGAKGHPSDNIPAGKTITLCHVQEAGIVNRIWMTIENREATMLRGLVINMYWDGETKPAVSVPLGDFFGVGLGQTATFENALFANPEGRSFNSFIQMPFKKGAKIELVNETDTDVNALFYDIDMQLLEHWNEDFLYFHCYWQRDTATALGKDFEILPKILGKGRYLGTNMSIIANKQYKDYWWGEGEVKIYLNGDEGNPTLVGTGTEDYIGTAWGQGKFINRYSGCSIADQQNLKWSFYRFHIPDPVYFKTDCRVTIQQIGGSMRDNVTELQENGVPLIPVTVSHDTTLLHLYQKDSVIDLAKANLPDGWTNFYRSDDVSAVAYFYLNAPKNNLPKLQPLEVRTWNLK